MFDYNIMPPKKEIIKKKKRPLKQKQKQKQSVRQNVKVTVQSSGGSGAGGTSVPAMAPQIQYVPQYQSMPTSFLDRSGENVAQRNLVSEAVKAPVRTEIKSKSSEEVPYEPANDASTFNAVFNAPSDLEKPLVAGVGVVSETKKVRADKGKPRGSYKEKQVNIGRNIQNEYQLGVSESEGGYGSPQTMQNLGFQEPVGFPARSRYLAQLESNQKLGMM
jgi:hypothetical protein